MPVTEDLIFAPMIDAALGCLQVTLVTHPSPPGRICVRWGDHVTIGMAIEENECCTGLAWVRLVDAVPTTDADFPNSTDELRLCATQWSAQIEYGIARCAPVGDAHTLPTCGDWTTLKTNASFDMLYLRETICCLQDMPAYRDVVVGDFTPNGPEGMCYSTTVNLWVRLVGCDECAD